MSLPPPPVRPELDLRAFHYMAVDVVRLRDSEFVLKTTGDEFRAGFLLRCASWHQKPASSLPNNDVMLAFLAGFGRDLDGWLRVRQGALDGFVECSDGRLYHLEVAEKALEAEKHRDINRTRTIAATAARRRQRDDDRHGQRHEARDDDQRKKAKEKVKGKKSNQTQERVPVATDKTAAASPPETLSRFLGSVLKEADAPQKTVISIMRTELPADWMPTDELCEEVKRDFHMDDADLQTEVPAFRALNAQEGTRSRDWNATFRLFCKRWKEHREKRFPLRAELTTRSGPINSALHEPTEAEWDSQVKFYVKTGRWSAQFGPEPGSHACRCPKHFLEKHGIDPATGEKLRPIAPSVQVGNPQ